MSVWNLTNGSVGMVCEINFTGESNCETCGCHTDFGRVKMTFFGIVEHKGKSYYSFVPQEPMICGGCGEQTYVYLEKCDEEN